jgi:hypothetical protein
MGRGTDRFEVVERKIGSGRCVVFDGATATELARLSGNRSAGERLWGTDALGSSPDYVLSVHRRYAGAGYDVISTNAWGLPGAARQRQTLGGYGPVHWTDASRDAGSGSRAGRRLTPGANECAVTFSLRRTVGRPPAMSTDARLRSHL